MSKIRVAILDDHQSMLDGYTFRLRQHPKINVVATARYADELPALLYDHEIDLLLLDISVPISMEDAHPYPILHTIPQILEENPDLSILVVSMHKQSSLIQSVMEAGAKGYILKDDPEAILRLGDIVVSVAAGGVYFSKQSYDVLARGTGGPRDFPKLTQRQVEALSLCAAFPDTSTSELSERLSIAPSTLRNLLSTAYEHLGVHNRAAAIVRARQLGLITPFPLEPGTQN